MQNYGGLKELTGMTAGISHPTFTSGTFAVSVQAGSLPGCADTGHWQTCVCLHEGSS